MKITKNICTAIALCSSAFGVTDEQWFTDEQCNDLKSKYVAFMEELDEGKFSLETMRLIAEKLEICPKDATEEDLKIIFLSLCLNSRIGYIEHWGVNLIKKDFQALMNGTPDEYTRYGFSHMFGNSTCNVKFDLRNTHCDITTVAELIKRSDRITELILIYDDIDDLGVIALSDALKVNKSLKFLNLERNKFGDSGVIALSEALKVNESLYHLRLGFNGFGVPGAIALSDALKVNKSLKFLTLKSFGSNVDMDDKLKALSEGLKVNKSLIYLDLDNCKMSISGATALSDALKVNDTLFYLVLEFCHLGSSGVKALSEGLKDNKKLGYLNLKDNKITLKNDKIDWDGAEALAEALKINTSLVCLDLRNNDFNNLAVRFLSEALKVNTSLLYLNLCYNKIDNSDANFLSKALEVNTSLIYLGIMPYFDKKFCPFFTKSGQKALDDAKQKNISIVMSFYTNYDNDLPELINQQGDYYKELWTYNNNWLGYMNIDY